MVRKSSREVIAKLEYSLECARDPKLRMDFRRAHLDYAEGLAFSLNLWIDLDKLTINWEKTKMGEMKKTIKNRIAKSFLSNLEVLATGLKVLKKDGNRTVGMGLKMIYWTLKGMAITRLWHLRYDGRGKN